MKRLLQFFGRSILAGGGLVASFVLWTLWLGLVILLVLQLYIATTSELTVPAFAMERLQARLAEYGLRATFQRTSFDPTGRVLIEEARLLVAPYTDPVVHARMVYVRLNPWLLAVGKVEPREIRISGGTAGVPAMLAPSGQPEVIVRDFDALLVPGDREMKISQFTARVGGIVVSAHGTLPRPRPSPDQPRRPLAELLAQRFPGWCRQAIASVEQLAALREPTLNLEFVPSESGAAQVNVKFLARGLRLEQPFVAQADDLRVESRVLVFGDQPTLSRIDATLGEVQLPWMGGMTGHGVRAVAYGRLRPDSWQFEPRTIELTADLLTAAGVPMRGLSAELFPRPLPRLDAVLAVLVSGAPLAVRAETDFRAQTAVLRFEGTISPALLEPLGRKLGVDVKKYFDFASLECADGEARLGPGWKFEQLTAQAALKGINAYGVRMEEGRATVLLDPKRFFSPEAFGRIGENFARGSYEQEFATLRYRFLLAGRLRPMTISGWFAEWWPNFFQQLEFPVTPPAASVEVSGTWRAGERTAVFVYADAPKPVLRGAAFDHVRTRLFLRPGFFDGLELFGTQGSGSVRGTFNYQSNPVSHAWRSFDVAAESSLDLELARTMAGAPGAKLLAPFQIATPPEIRLRGHFDGPGAVAGQHFDLAIEAATSGEFRFYHFPLQDVSFTARLRDDEITVEKMQARFAGGSASGHARVWGTGPERRVGFDYALKGASLGEAAAALAEFIGHQRGSPPTPPGKFVQEKANVRIDLAASAEGRFSDMHSYKGQGNASLEGAEIGAVPLLGALSELLKFTALRFTSASANFKIEGPRLIFPEIALRGANSGIDAHGDYALDRHELDFKAKIFPFQESGSLIKSVVGVVLTPFSNVFEVQLSGTLEKPTWGLAAFAGERPPAERAPERDAAEKAAPSPSTPPAAPPTTDARRAVAAPAS